MYFQFVGMERPYAREVWLGGRSSCEGAWRLAPLGEGQAVTCRVYVSAVDLEMRWGTFGTISRAR